MRYRLFENRDFDLIAHYMRNAIELDEWKNKYLKYIEEDPDFVSHVFRDSWTSVTDIDEVEGITTRCIAVYGKDEEEVRFYYITYEVDIDGNVGEDVGGHIDYAIKDNLGNFRNQKPVKSFDEFKKILRNFK